MNPKSQQTASTSPAPQRYQDFSAQIKAQYPEYRDIDDFELAQKVIQKYPQFKDQVSFSTGDIFDKISSQIEWDDTPPPPKPSPPSLTRAQADQQMDNITTLGMGQWHPQAGGPSFTDYVNSEAPEFGGPIPTATHFSFTADQRAKGMDLVPFNQVGNVRSALSFDAAHPDLAKQQEQAQYNAWKNDNSVPFSERILRRGGTHVRQVISETDATNAANEQWLREAGEFGANAGEKLIRARFPEGQEPSPEQVGAYREIGRFATTMAADPVTYATFPLGGMGGKGGQMALSAAFGIPMAKGSYDAIQQLRNRTDLTPQQRSELGTEAALNILFAGLSAHHFTSTLLGHGEPIPHSDSETRVTPKVNSSVDRDLGVPHPNPLSTEGRVAPPPDKTPVSEKAQARASQSSVDGDGFSGLGEDQSVRVPTNGGAIEKASPSALETLEDTEDQIPREEDRSETPYAGTRLAFQNSFLQYLYDNVPHNLADRYSSGLSTFLSKFPENPTLDFTRSDAERYVKIRRSEDASYSAIKSELNAFDSFRTWTMQNVAGSLVGPALVASRRFQARTGKPPLTLDDLRQNLKRRFGNSDAAPTTRETPPSPLEERLAENGSSEQGQDSPQPQKPSHTSEPATRQLTPRQLRNIEKAKARWTPEKLAPLREEAEHNVNVEPSISNSNASEAARTIDRRTENSLAAYGMVKTQIKMLQARLEMAKNAVTKGFSRMARTPEEVAGMEQDINNLRRKAASLFSEHVKGLDEKETEALVTAIEEPIYRQIGKAMQLHQLLMDDPIAKGLKQALIEDVSPNGLSQTSRARVREIMGDERVGTRLTKGVGGQRTRIYDKLGYEESDNQALKFLKFPPDIDKAKRTEAWIKQELKTETDPEKISVLKDKLDKAERITERLGRVHEQVEIARNYAREMAETETDPKKKLFYQKMGERVGSKPNVIDDSANRIANLRSALEKETNPARRVQIEAGIRKAETDASKPKDTAEDTRPYRYTPILVKPKVKGEAKAATSKDARFIERYIPGQIKEISGKNLKAILGDEYASRKLEGLRPHEKAALNNLTSPDGKSPSWYQTPAGREYMALKYKFMRERVEEARDDIVSSIKDNMNLVSAVKKARGIPADHLTRLENAVLEMIETLKAGDQRRSQRQPAGFLTEAAESQKHSQPQNRPH